MEFEQKEFKLRAYSTTCPCFGGRCFYGWFQKILEHSTWWVICIYLYMTYILAFLVSWKNLLVLQNSFLRIAWGGSNKVNIFPKLNGGLEVIYRDGICKQINLNKHRLLSSGTKLCQLQNRIDFRGSNFWFQSRIMECSWWQFVTHLLPENCA